MKHCWRIESVDKKALARACFFRSSVMGYFSTKILYKQVGSISLEDKRICIQRIFPVVVQLFFISHVWFRIKNCWQQYWLSSLPLLVCKVWEDGVNPYNFTIHDIQPLCISDHGVRQVSQTCKINWGEATWFKLDILGMFWQGYQINCLDVFQFKLPIRHQYD